MAAALMVLAVLWILPFDSNVKFVKNYSSDYHY